MRAFPFVIIERRRLFLPPEPEKVFLPCRREFACTAPDRHPGPCYMELFGRKYAIVAGAA